MDWAEFRVGWLQTFLTLPAGIPSADTFRRIFCSLDPNKFAVCFQRMIAELVDGGANYLLALKGNQPLLHAEVLAYFEHARHDRTLDATPLAFDETVDKDHGRLETRRAWCTADITSLGERTKWKGLRTIAMIERQREIGGNTSLEQAYYLSTLAPDATLHNRLARRHCSVENELQLPRGSLGRVSETAGCRLLTQTRCRPVSRTTRSAASS